MAPNTNGGTPAYDPKRALAPAQQTALASLADEQAQKAAQLYKALLPNGSKLSDTEALAGAMYARATGLDPIRGEFYIVPGIGVAPGYKGEQKQKAAKTHFHYRFRPMTPEECTWHGITAKDIGVVCVFIDIDLAAEMRHLGLEYTPTEGIGVLREDETYNTEEWRDNPQNGRRYKAKLPRDKWTPGEPPKGRTWTWKAQQRSLKDALNHTPGFEYMAQELEETAEEILARGAAAVDGFEYPPEGARLGVDQARAWVDQQRRRELWRNDPDYAAAQLTKAQEMSVRSTLTRQYDDFVMSDQPCPHCGTRGSLPLHANDCPFRTLYPNAAKLPEPKPPTDVEEGQYVDEPRTEDEFDALVSAREELGLDQQAADAAELDRVHQQLQQAAHDGELGEPDDQLKRRLWGALGNLFGADDKGKKEFLKWAYKVDSSKELTIGMVWGVINFVNAEPVGGDWVPCDEALAFLRTFRRAVLGQDELL